MRSSFSSNSFTAESNMLDALHNYLDQIFSALNEAGLGSILLVVWVVVSLIFRISVIFN